MRCMLLFYVTTTIDISGIKSHRNSRLKGRETWQLPFAIDSINGNSGMLLLKQTNKKPAQSEATLIEVECSDHGKNTPTAVVTV